MRGLTVTLGLIVPFLATGALSAPLRKAPDRHRPLPSTPKGSNQPAPVNPRESELLGPELKRLYALLGGRYQVTGEVLEKDSGQKLGDYRGPSVTQAVMGGKYLRATRVLSMPDGIMADSETLTTYDTALGKYRQWLFSSRAPGPSEFTGTLEDGVFVGKSTDGSMTFRIRRRSATQLEGVSELVIPNGGTIIQKYVAILVP
jgi:hypothetical protein